MIFWESSQLDRNWGICSNSIVGSCLIYLETHIKGSVVSFTLNENVSGIDNLFEYTENNIGASEDFWGAPRLIKFKSQL